MAAVWALVLFTTRTVSLFLSRINAMRTKWKHGKSDEIMSHGSTSRGVTLALFMAAMQHSPGTPVLLLWTLECHLQHHASIFHPKAFCFTTEQVNTLWQSILVRPWLINNCSLPIDAGSIWLVFNHIFTSLVANVNSFQCDAPREIWLPGFIGTGGVNETQAKPGRWHQRQAQLDYWDSWSFCDSDLGSWKHPLRAMGSIKGRSPWRFNLKVQWKNWKRVQTQLPSKPRATKQVQNPG